MDLKEKVWKQKAVNKMLLHFALKLNIFIPLPESKGERAIDRMKLKYTHLKIKYHKCEFFARAFKIDKIYGKKTLFKALKIEC